MDYNYQFFVQCIRYFLFLSAQQTLSTSFHFHISNVQKNKTMIEKNVALISFFSSLSVVLVPPPSLSLPPTALLLLFVGQYESSYIKFSVLNHSPMINGKDPSQRCFLIYCCTCCCCCDNDNDGHKIFNESTSYVFDDKCKGDGATFDILFVIW